MNLQGKEAKAPFFSPGQKVTLAKPLEPCSCKDCAPQGGYPPGPLPQFGSVYTVSNAYLTDDHSRFEMIELHEIVPSQTEQWFPGFRASLFRLVVERPTDISVFERLCVELEQRHRVPVPAGIPHADPPGAPIPYRDPTDPAAAARVSPTAPAEPLWWTEVAKYVRSLCRS